MELQRLARSALSGLSKSTTTTSTMPNVLARAFGASQSPVTSPFFFRRQLSTTAMRLAPPPPAPPSPGGSGASWPPKRSPAPSSTSSPSSSSVPTAQGASSSSPTKSSDPLKELYSSDNPAQWAMWSSDDFYKKHIGGGQGSGGRGGAGGPVSGTKIPLKPISGRTVYVGGNVDQARAFTLLNLMCLRNRVPADFFRQRWHERPGLKRKRLRSVRWRRRFHLGMRARIARVNELAKQGW